MTYYHHWRSPLGDILLLSDGEHLLGIHFAREKYYPSPDADWQPSGDLRVMQDTQQQLAEYFAGRLTTFEVPLRPIGTPFQRQVWQALLDIPYGTTQSYGALAARLGDPGLARAVGNANSRNPISIIVPCHRVIGQNGSLTGYAGGIERKRALLALEAASAPFELSAA